MLIAKMNMLLGVLWCYIDDGKLDDIHHFAFWVKTIYAHVDIWRYNSFS